MQITLKNATNKLVVWLIGIIFLIINIVPTLCLATEDYTEYTTDNLTISFPSDWYVMYDGMDGLEEMYTNYGFTSYDKWKEYTDGSLIEAVNIPEGNLSSEDSFFDDTTMDIFVMNDTPTYPVDFTELKDLSSDEKETYMNDLVSKLKSSSQMSSNNPYYKEGENLDFIYVDLSGMGYHYELASTVIGGQVFNIYALSKDNEDIVAQKIEVLESIANTFSYDTSNMVADVTTISEDANSTNDEQVTSTSIFLEPQTTPKQDITTIIGKLPLGLFIIALVVILIYGCKFKRGKQIYHEDFLSLEVTKGIQGFSAVGIMLHHMAQQITNNGNDNLGSINFFGNIGVFFVGVFFFCSGYGLYTSLKNKENYLKGFFRKRLSSILVPFYVGNTLFIVTSMLMGAKYETKDLIAGLSGWLLINTQLWFIVEIFVLYILFYIIFKFIKNENVSYTVMGLCIVGIMVGSLLLGHDYTSISGGTWFKGEWWYNGILLFFVGMTIAKFYKSIIKITQKCYQLLLAIGVAGTVLLYNLTSKQLATGGYWYEWDGYLGYKEKFITLACQVPMIIFGVCTLFLITQKIQFKNRVLSFLGGISFELYIIHNMFITNLRDNINISNNFIYILSVYVMSISLAYLLNRFDKKIINLIKGIKSNKEILKKHNTHNQHFIDCLRLIMMFLVVCIHAPMDNVVGEVLFAIGKTAVPFFIVVSGYFCYRDDNSILISRLKKQFSKITTLCIGANFLYIYVYLIFSKLGYSPESLVSLVTDKSLINLYLYNENPVVSHLWFLGSLMYALVIMIALTKIKLHKYIMYISPVLIGVYVYLSTFGTGDMIAYRNCILVTLPYFMMGCLIHRYENAIRKYLKPSILIVISLVAFIGIFAELFIRKNLGVPFISVEIFIYLLVLVGLYFSNVGKNTIFEWLGSKCTLFIYIFHMIVLWIIWFVIPTQSDTFYNLSAIITFVVTTLVCGVPKFIKQKLVEKSSSEKSVIKS